MPTIFLCVFLFVVRFPSNSLSTDTQDVVITPDHVVQEVDDMFVGVTIDSSQMTRKTAIPNLSSAKLAALAQGLTPSYLRVGGTWGDEMIMDLNTTTSTHIRFVVSLKNWDALNEFCRKTGLKLIFGLNALDRKDGKWDPTNTKALLQYSAKKGYNIAGFELGNEPNLYYRLHRNVSGAELAADFQELKRVLQSSSYKNSLLLGPDSAGYKDWYIIDFMAGGGHVVDAVTFHEYYMNGRTATLRNFTDPTTLDYLKGNIEAKIADSSKENPPRPVWLGETSSAASGGAVNISDRYIAGVLWLDELGMSARWGLKGVMRQELYGGNYGLLQANFDPNPDYWLTVLYKRLVGNKVFDVQTPGYNTRVYAHCTRLNNQYNYTPGSLTVYGINLNNDSITLQFPHLQGQNRLDVFWLTPENDDPQAQKVKLNGKTLEFVNNSLPSLKPSLVTSGSVTVPGKTFGFIVMPDANIAACKTTGHSPIVG